MKPLLIVGLLAALCAGCATTTPVATCQTSLSNQLNTAMHQVEGQLARGCEYHFDQYFASLLSIAEANPAPDNRQLFSEHLVRVSESGVISKRQAKALYNRYFNVKFVSLTGDYSTCSQTCPVQADVMRNMQLELKDKERGLMKASEDQAGFYRANHLLEEAQLVLEATCRACASAGGR